MERRGGVSQLLLLSEARAPEPALERSEVDASLASGVLAVHARGNHLHDASPNFGLNFACRSLYERLASRGFRAFPHILTRARDPRGARAVSILLDERKVPVSDVDAVCAANDGMALGFMEALQARGIRVPQDLALTGFDYGLDAQFAHAPLTTVRQRLAIQG